MMDALIQVITPDSFMGKVISEKKPTLLLCMPQDDDFPSQLTSIESIARRYRSWLKVGLLEEAFIENFKSNLRITGTPTYLFFLNGYERGRMLGLADPTGLERFIFEMTDETAKESMPERQLRK
jgi:hypothetical protein